MMESASIVGAFCFAWLAWSACLIEEVKRRQFIQTALCFLDEANATGVSEVFMDGSHRKTTRLSIDPDDTHDACILFS